jgi:hypothetical protein
MKLDLPGNPKLISAGHPEMNDGEIRMPEA